MALGLKVLGLLAGCEAVTHAHCANTPVVRTFIIPAKYVFTPGGVAFSEQGRTNIGNLLKSLPQTAQLDITVYVEAPHNPISKDAHLRLGAERAERLERWLESAEGGDRPVTSSIGIGERYSRRFNNRIEITATLAD